MIGIALLTLVPGELGGSESAARELLRALARGGTLPYRVYLPPVAPDARRGAARRRSSTEYRAARTIRGRLAAMSLAAARPGPLVRRLSGADAVHYPLTIRIPPVKAPTAVTLHDVQHLDLPQLFSRGEREFRKLAYHRSARSARLVIVPSAFVRDRAEETLGLDRDRIRVIHHGIDHERFTPGRRGARAVPALPGAPVAAQEPRPAVRGVRAAAPGPARAAARAHRRRALAARPRTASRCSGTSGSTSSSRSTGAPSALVFPSLYEGFGLPPLEAMACGCPVACSVAASLPEVCGDAARYFAPDEPDEIAAAVADVLADPAAWSARGIARAAEFTWERSAQAHEDVYRELLAA